MSTQGFFYHYMVSRFHNSIQRQVDIGILDKHKICGLNVAEPGIRMDFKPNEVKPTISVTEIEGSYSDPLHPGCLREISATSSGSSGALKITGSDNFDGSNPFELMGHLDFKSGDLVVDFSPKGGPESLRGEFHRTTEEIEWPDGNKWAKRNAK